MTTIVFVGPTLPASEVSRRLPGATIAPPVAVGDVLRLARRRTPLRIAIVDGYFERMAAVWHKEILIALERGIAVWGAASMGALRAAELTAFGMVGVGAIFRDYAAGRLVADDEVAVAHLPGQFGYRATSDALVNLRYGIARAPMLSPRTRAALVELAIRRFYRERSWDRLVADARGAGLVAAQIDAFATWPKPDRKADDARLLLRRLARASGRTAAWGGLSPFPGRSPREALGYTEGLAPLTPGLRVPRTWALRQLEASLRTTR